jgi:hypothetical protein
LLKESKPRRFEEQVEAELQTRGYELTGLKLPAKIQLLKQDMDEKEEHTGGEVSMILTSTNTSNWYRHTSTNQSLKIETYL